MLDDLREQAEDAPYEDKEETPSYDYMQEERTHFLGMTPFQRFIIAVLLLFATCILSTFCLLVTERVFLPIF
ncbi:MAG: hypothetical protein PVF74_10720 [Anaerolineales bacterium]|jgi:hypothetical protein